MSYQTTVSGEIRIDPPLPIDESLAKSGFPGTVIGAFGSKDVALKVVETPVEDSPGTYRREAVAIIPVHGPGYRMVEHTQEVIDRWGEGRTFTGLLACWGEEAGDLWRLEVQNGRAVKVTPRIIWPDGAEEPRR